MMKRSNPIFAASLAALLLLSCVPKTKYEQATQEADSLLMVNMQTKREFDEMLTTLNEVEDGLTQIKEAENYLVVQSTQKGEANASVRQRLQSDMELVTTILQENREKLASLTQKLSQSKNQSQQLSATIKRLTEENAAHTTTIVRLQEELSKRNIRINELSQDVEQLVSTVDTLKSGITDRQAQIEQQERELNTVWYVYGTKSELKEENIVAGGTLFKSLEVLPDNFNKEYFITSDLRMLKEIPLVAQKAEILSKHPTGSYTLQPNEEKLLTLVITDPELFWSLTHYLVVEVK